MFKTRHLHCTSWGSLRLILDTDWASVSDAVDFDFGTASYPSWPGELGQEPDWFWPEVMALYDAQREVA